MGLEKYKAKRHLKLSGEPSAGYPRISSSLRFCVQKHSARHLHYDFRLEYRGVLLSWAIPKGPSNNPEDKRLAIQVEDHPLEYQYFEGMIPKGNYGAGKVEIWDAGFYSIPAAKTTQEAEKSISKGLKKGHFTLLLQGKKLKGEFTFQKLKSDPTDHNWLLIKTSSFEQNAEIEKPTKMPQFISPMLATLIDAAFDDEAWLFETKWDGFRALAFINKHDVKLLSRTKHLWNAKFPEIVENLKQIDHQVILDGELVVVDAQGRSDFQLIQNYQKTGKGHLWYCIFDILYQDGQDLKSLPLIQRKQILSTILKETTLPHVRFSDYVIGKGKACFQQAKKKQLEGIIGKKISSSYQSKRSREWVKIKTSLRQEVVVGGFTTPKGSRQKFGALLVGVYNDQQELIYSGRVGGGFDALLLQQVHRQLIPLIQKETPFKNPPKSAATWVKPQQVCEVSFAEWTQQSQMRQPIFKGMRIDKEAKNVKKETAELYSKKQFALSNLSKIYWPEDKYTKGDLLEYYKTMAPYILPHLKNRPIMLHRFPEGIMGTEFYQKDLKNTPPKWLTIYPVEHQDSTIHYLGINNLRSLLYAVNLGSIDLHPFLSRYRCLEKPDFCVLDLDPQGVSFSKVIDTALAIHEILEELQVKNFCKTSGSAGLHIVIPLHAKYSYEQSRQFAEIIAHLVHKKLPKTTSIERSPEKRRKAIYLDCLQNRLGQTLAAPYSVRPVPKALVSTPILWSELDKNFDPRAFDLKSVPARVKEKGDLFAPVLGAGVDLKKALKHL
jgi:bifunctional non-homologous end joining protein LigD